tara:strand:- start:310 stop:1041 length:732 start_codon:yes stop_codon:yes gene_type:complete
MTAAFISSRPARKKMEFAEVQASELQRKYGYLDAPELLEVMIKKVFYGDITIVSSFGTEAAILLALVSDIDSSTPVVFVETGKHFPETLAYRDKIISTLKLTAVKSVAPSPIDLNVHDPDGDLWSKNPNLCCYLRKVISLEKALAGFNCWVTGRKQIHSGARTNLQKIDSLNGRIKINPLADWDQQRIKSEFTSRRLPLHPLSEKNYTSVGCLPCTRPTKSGEGYRDGRWSGIEKTECGIHND